MHATASAQRTVLPFMWYNVENLMDTLDDPLKDEDEFLPGSPMQWTSARYHTKLDSLSSMVQLVQQPLGAYPAFIGVCEVENRQVLQDWADRLHSKGAPRYSIVHYDCAYHRGVDVALLYDSTRVTVQRSQPLPIAFDFDSTTTTRDILYVQLRAQQDDLHLYLNHWPSRRQDDRYRMVAAQRLRTHLDSLQRATPTAKVLMLGDFNDDPTSPSVTQGLQALPYQSTHLKTAKPTLLYNLSAPLHAGGRYTYLYKDQKNMLDHCTISGTLLKARKGWQLQFHDIGIYDTDQAHSIVGENRYIRRTYVGNKYLGGYSDHLPVYGRLIFLGR